MNIYFTGIVFFILTIIYILNNYKRHYQDIEKNDSNRILVTNIEKYIEKLELIMFLFLIIGFISYFLKQKSEQKNFNYLYFLFGKKECKNLK